MEINNCIYRFINTEGEIVYIGKACNLKNRISSHNHLSKKCYEEVDKIEYTCFPTEDIMDWAERYYIPKHKPKYNKTMKQRSFEGFNIKELDKRKWNTYKEQLTRVEDIDTRVIDILSGKIFDNKTEASRFHRLCTYDVTSNIKGEKRRCYGRKREMLCFMDYTEYENSNEEEIMLKKELALNIGLNTKERVYRQIRCIELNEVFSEEGIDFYCEDRKISKQRLKANLKGAKDYAIAVINGEYISLTFEYI